MARVWFSGFETGDFSEWIGGISATESVQSSIVRSGNYAALCPSGHLQYVWSGNIVSLTSAYYRAYVYVSGLPSANTAILSTANSGDLVDISVIRLNTNGTLTTLLDNGTTTLGTGTTVIPVATWTLIELKTVIDASAGVVEVRVNGIVDQTYTGLTTNTWGNITGFSIASTSSLTTVNIYFDDIAVDNAQYPGPGKVIARQGTAGTPTYDTWTKHGAATAALCWSDTPYSTATYCDDSTLSDKQTMLVWPFNTVQTGHGSDTVGPVDTINAAKVSTIAKSASAGNMDILFRYGGSDNATTVTLTTSDAYYESSYLTPTAANLNASEIGANNDLTSVLTTIEDCWLQVDYTPNTSNPFLTVEAAITINLALS